MHARHVILYCTPLAFAYDTRLPGAQKCGRVCSIKYRMLRAEARLCVGRKHERPRSKLAALRIYEAHVGMSSEEPAVASYTYFKGVSIPQV